MFPKKVIAALCAAVLALAMPTMAFASYSGASGISGVDAQGYSWRVVAEYAKADEQGVMQDDWKELKIIKTSTAPSNWNSNLYNPTGTFFTISGDGTDFTDGDYAYIHITLHGPVNIPQLYVEHDNGSTEIARNTGYAGAQEEDYYVYTYCMRSLSTIGFGDTSTPVASDSDTSLDSDSSFQGGSMVGGTLSPKTGIDMDGQLFAISACGIAAAGVSVVAIRRMARSK